jgi:NADPH-ferrihemoprotein reductase
VARWQGLELDQWFTLEPAAGAPAQAGLPFPVPCSVRTALTRFLDLQGRVDRDLVLQLSRYAATAAERARMRRLGGGGGGGAAARAEFEAWSRASQRSVAEVFREFSLRAAPLERLLQVVPRLQPRFFTIASSARAAPGRACIVASMVDAQKPGGDAARRLRGVASGTLMRLAEAADAKPPPPPLPRPLLRVLVRASSFRLPAHAATPVILVGPGTGIAPMIAFLQERRWQRAQAAGAGAGAGAAAVGAVTLFFGCRARDEDFIFRAELESFLADGTLAALHLAFSRAQERKVYVQHLLAERGAEVFAALEGDGVGSGAGAAAVPAEARRAHVYVCGATSMGHDVLKAFEALAERGLVARSAAALGADAARIAAVAYVKRLQAEGRYTQELWSS